MPRRSRGAGTGRAGSPRPEPLRAGGAAAILRALTSPRRPRFGGPVLRARPMPRLAPVFCPPPRTGGFSGRARLSQRPSPLSTERRAPCRGRAPACVSAASPPFASRAGEPPAILPAPQDRLQRAIRPWRAQAPAQSGRSGLQIRRLRAPVTQGALPAARTGRLERAPDPARAGHRRAAQRGRRGSRRRDLALKRWEVREPPDLRQSPRRASRLGARDGDDRR